MHDDALYETEDVAEALRRLPRNVVDERNYRIARALHLSTQKKILQKSEWTTLDSVSSVLCIHYISSCSGFNCIQSLYSCGLALILKKQFHRSILWFRSVSKYSYIL